MKRFKKILVVFNSKTDNQTLIDRALAIAKRNEASLTIVDVIEEESSNLYKRVFQQSPKHPDNKQFPIIEEIPFLSRELSSPKKLSENSKPKTEINQETVIDIQEFILEEEHRNLQQFVESMVKAGIQVESKTLFGIPFVKVIQEVINKQHDLVMVTTDGEGFVKGTLLGSTTMHLMRKCPCPVWVIKPNQGNHYHRILAAVDLAHEDNERTELANKILELATSLARLEQSELLIVHAWNLFGESILKGRGGISEEDLEELIYETRSLHRTLLMDNLIPYLTGDLKTEVYLLKGDPALVITNLAQAKAPDLIILGSVSRTGIPGLLIGNTAEKVLRDANCSILTVKPEGFVSPVK